MSKAEDVKVIALDFIKSYARENQFFTGVTSSQRSGNPAFRGQSGTGVTSGVP